jgi:hypothetical protein
VNQPVIFLTLFGTTTGLEVLNFPLSNSALPFKIEDSWIEVSPSHLIIKPGKESYVILRRFVGTQTLTWIGLYRAAKEIGYERQGSFYGSGVWLIDRVVDVKLAIDVLRMMADQIQAKAMNGDSFVKRLADVRGDISPPSQVAALSDNPVKINSGCHPSGETAFINAGANPLEVIDWAQRAASAQFLNRIFIGSQDQSPDAGGRVSTQVFRSLASAIDSTFNRKTSDLQKKVSELDLKVKELNQHNTNLHDDYLNIRSQIEGVRGELNSAKLQLQDSSLSYRREFARAEQLQTHLNTLHSKVNTTVTSVQIQRVDPNPIAPTQLISDAPRQPPSHQSRLPSHSAHGLKKSDSHSHKAGLKFELISMLLSFIFGICIGALIISLLSPKQPENQNTATGMPPAVSNSPSASDAAIDDANSADSKVNFPMSDQGSKDTISKPYSKN